jgi:mono/diheme cytochrome c family protein
MGLGAAGLAIFRHRDHARVAGAAHWRRRAPWNKIQFAYRRMRTRRREAYKKRSERNAMIILRNLACAFACALPWLIVPAQAQETAQGPQHPGRSVVMSKCFQCHTDAMFRDQRQDRRGWEAAIYRMIGRGGLWTKDEITLMADYLGTDFGPNAKPATQTR